MSRWFFPPAKPRIRLQRERNRGSLLARSLRSLGKASDLRRKPRRTTMSIRSPMNHPRRFVDSGRKIIPHREDRDGRRMREATSERIRSKDFGLSSAARLRRRGRSLPLAEITFPGGPPAPVDQFE